MWQRRSVITGGTVTSIAVAHASSSLRSFAATPLGLFVSDDLDFGWRRVVIEPSTRWVRLVTVSPAFQSDNTVFAATEDTVYISEDAGETWSRRLTGGRFNSLAVSPNFANDRVVFAGTDEQGVLRSTDAGNSWRSANPGLLDFSVYAIALPPDFENDQTGYLGTPTGIYQTRNGGQSWREIDTGVIDPAVQCIAVSPSFERDRTILVGTESHGLLRSTDGGVTWLEQDPKTGQSIAAVTYNNDHPDGNTIALASETGVFHSRGDSFEWHEFATAPGTALDLAFVPETEGDKLLAGLHKRGVARTSITTGEWTAKNNGLQARLISNLTASASRPGASELYATDGEGGLVTSSDAGHTWVDIPESETCGHVATISQYQGAESQSRLFLGTVQGVAGRDEKGYGWRLLVATQDPVLAVAAHESPNEIPTGWVCGITAKSSFVVSEDGGTSWKTISQQGNMIDSAALELSPDFANDGIVFAATTVRKAEGQGGHMTTLWYSGDAGSHWTPLLRDQGSGVCPLASVTTQCGEGALVAITERNVHRVSISLLQSTNADLKQAVESTSIPPGLGTVTDLIAVGRQGHRSTLIGATSNGVIASFDAGDSFTQWQGGLDVSRFVSVCEASTPGGATEVIALELGGAVWARKLSLLLRL